jgi:hypothetical protein
VWCLAPAVLAAFAACQPCCPYRAQGAGLLGTDAYMTNYACNTTYELVEKQSFTRTGEPKKARQLLPSSALRLLARRNARPARGANEETDSLLCWHCRLSFSARTTCSTQQHVIWTTIRTWASIQAATIPSQSRCSQTFSEPSACTVVRSTAAFGRATTAQRRTSDGCARRSTGGASKTTRQ